jgi:hypothetical protein
MAVNDQFIDSPSREKSNSSRAIEWAAIITGRPDVRNGSVAHAHTALLDWWTQSAEEISRRLSEFPGPFQTTHFKKEIRFIEGPLTALKSVFDSLRIGESSFSEAIEHIGRNFAWEQQRLLRWKTGLENIEAIISWLPAYLRILDYLTVALPLGREAIDQARATLLQSTREPCRFLEASTRLQLEAEFIEFKKSYADAYYFLHEDALHIISGSKRGDLKIDPVQLRNLDRLSSLPHMDKSYLNRVKLLAKWVQRNHCNLPVRQILERYPRCYCNFNPSSCQQPDDSAAQINGIIRDGIEYFRAQLRKCNNLITAELKAQPVEDSIQLSIDILLGDGPIPALKPPVIKVLYRIIGKYPNEFLAIIRKR